MGELKQPIVIVLLIILFYYSTLEYIKYYNGIYSNYEQFFKIPAFNEIYDKLKTKFGDPIQLKVNNTIGLLWKISISSNIEHKIFKEITLLFLEKDILLITIPFNPLKFYNNVIITDEAFHIAFSKILKIKSLRYNPCSKTASFFCNDWSEALAYTTLLTKICHMDISFDDIHKKNIIDQYIKDEQLCYSALNKLFNT